MRVLVLLSAIAMAAALTSKEIQVISDYAGKFGGDCYTMEVTAEGNDYLVESTGIPNHPIYTTNPNDAAEQAYSYYVPKTPVLSSTQSLCVPMGEIGFALNGVPFYNPLSGPDSNAVQGTGAETFDACGGHPDQMGKYHYHELPSLECVFHDNVLPDNGNGTLLGVALDGFPIYYWDQADEAMLEELLDECHGTDKLGGTYRYYVTGTYPYSIGCFRGEVVNSRSVTGSCPATTQKDLNLCSCDRSGIKWLPFDDITDSECRNELGCGEEMSTDLWCHTSEIRPLACDTKRDNPCPAQNNAGVGPPTSGQQQPPSGQQQPPSGQQQPSTNQQQPSTNQQQPSTNQQQPSTNQQQPSTNQQQPSTNQQQPAQRPSYGQQQPSNNQQQPAQRPSYGQQQPSNNQQQPAQRPQQQSGSPPRGGRAGPRRGRELATSLRSLIKLLENNRRTRK